jgi:hypothetical protein
MQNLLEYVEVKKESVKDFTVVMYKIKLEYMADRTKPMYLVVVRRDGARMDEHEFEFEMRTSEVYDLVLRTIKSMT